MIKSAIHEVLNKKPFILIVDDNPTNLHVLANTLGEEYEVLVATNGIRALEIANDNELDLILLDIMMPDMSGFEVCSRLKSQEQTKLVPVIFVTALNDIESEVKGLEMGAVDFINKPISQPVVIARVANHIKLYQQTKILNELARLDGLTNLANRREYDQQIRREWQRQIRNKGTLSLIMVDIDFFKAYNDHYGHGNGDICLKKVAKSIGENARRATDIIARFGGEEFVIILPETTLECAIDLANQMVENVADLKIPHEFSETANVVTISAGVSCVNPMDYDGFHQLESMADQALYQAKEQGRNQVQSVTGKPLIDTKESG